jgi:CheY-like chemotaxis protein
MAEEIKQVLMIEDDSDQMFLYKSAFDLQKIPSVMANGGKIGVEQAKRWLPKVIVLDIVMEGMDGEEVLKQLKADPTTKDIPVIVFTNLDKKPVKEKFMALGATEFWGKTELMPMALAAKVQDYFDRR